MSNSAMTSNGKTLNLNEPSEDLTSDFPAETLGDHHHESESSDAESADSDESSSDCCVIQPSKLALNLTNNVSEENWDDFVNDAMGHSVSEGESDAEDAEDDSEASQSPLQEESAAADEESTRLDEESTRLDEESTRLDEESRCGEGPEGHEELGNANGCTGSRLHFPQEGAHGIIERSTNIATHSSGSQSSKGSSNSTFPSFFSSGTLTTKEGEEEENLDHDIHDNSKLKNVDTGNASGWEGDEEGEGDEAWEAEDGEWDGEEEGEEEEEGKEGNKNAEKLEKDESWENELNEGAWEEDGEEDGEEEENLDHDNWISESPNSNNPHALLETLEAFDLHAALKLGNRLNPNVAKCQAAFHKYSTRYLDQKDWLRFRQVSLAYKVLSDSERKNVYEEFLDDGNAGGSAAIMLDDSSDEESEGESDESDDEDAPPKEVCSKPKEIANNNSTGKPLQSRNFVGAFEKLRASEAMSTDSVFDWTADDVFETFFSGTNDSERDYLLLNSTRHFSDSEDDNPNSIPIDGIIGYSRDVHGKAAMKRRTDEHETAMAEGEDMQDREEGIDPGRENSQRGGSMEVEDGEEAVEGNAQPKASETDKEAGKSVESENRELLLSTSTSSNSSTSANLEQHSESQLDHKRVTEQILEEQFHTCSDGGNEEFGTCGESAEDSSEEDSEGSKGCSESSDSEIKRVRAQRILREQIKKVTGVSGGNLEELNGIDRELNEVVERKIGEKKDEKKSSKSGKKSKTVKKEVKKDEKKTTEAYKPKEGKAADNKLHSKKQKANQKANAKATKKAEAEKEEMDEEEELLCEEEELMLESVAAEMAKIEAEGGKLLKKSELSVNVNGLDEASILKMVGAGSSIGSSLVGASLVGTSLVGSIPTRPTTNTSTSSGSSTTPVASSTPSAAPAPAASTSVPEKSDWDSALKKGMRPTSASSLTTPFSTPSCDPFATLGAPCLPSDFTDFAAAMKRATEAEKARHDARIAEKRAREAAAKEKAEAEKIKEEQGKQAEKKKEVETKEKEEGGQSESEEEGSASSGEEAEVKPIVTEDTKSEDKKTKNTVSHPPPPEFAGFSSSSLDDQKKQNVGKSSRFDLAAVCGGSSFFGDLAGLQKVKGGKKGEVKSNEKKEKKSDEGKNVATKTADIKKDAINKGVKKEGGKEKKNGEKKEKKKEQQRVEKKETIKEAKNLVASTNDNETSASSSASDSNTTASSSSSSTATSSTRKRKRTFRPEEETNEQKRRRMEEKQEFLEGRVARRRHRFFEQFSTRTAFHRSLGFNDGR